MPLNHLVLTFTNPSTLPTGGFLVEYRPKGTTDVYFTQTSLTGSPITITDDLIADTDYEGNVYAICSDTKISTVMTFSTSKY